MRSWMFKMDEIIGKGIKGNMKKILEEELCEISDFNIKEYPSVLDYLVQRLMNVVENYMTSEYETGMHLALYRKNHASVENFVKPGEILEVKIIEPFQ